MDSNKLFTAIDLIKASGTSEDIDTAHSILEFAIEGASDKYLYNSYLTPEILSKISVDNIVNLLTGIIDSPTIIADYYIENNYDLKFLTDTFKLIENELDVTIK